MQCLKCKKEINNVRKIVPYCGSVKNKNSCYYEYHKERSIKNFRNSYLEKREYHLKRRKVYYNNNIETEREKAKKYTRLVDKEKRKIIRKRYYIKNKEAIKNSNVKYPEKRKAWAFIQRKIINLEIKRLPCEVCGDFKSQAHHDDYSKPEDVRFLCQLHHSYFHIHHVYKYPRYYPIN